MENEPTNNDKQHWEPGDAGGCPFQPGMERHVWPAGNQEAIVTKTSSDEIFGPEGLGFKGNMWANIISWLARNGIQEQTGSKPDETDIANCVKGWGQGPFSSRVFNVEKGVDEDQLEALITHLEGISSEFKIKNSRITHKVLAAFVSTQVPRPYLTWTGMREVNGFKSRAGARFRGHIQWQAFVELCGQVDADGVKHVSPELIRTFFNSEEPFFQRITDRRHKLKEGKLSPGDPSGVLADVPSYIDLKATDLEYKRNKGGFWLVLKIGWYMLLHKTSKLGPLPIVDEQN